MESINRNGVITSILVAVIISLIAPHVFGELTPPYFNLAEHRKIYASATCGVGAADSEELYCKLVGAVGNESEHLIQGQVRFFIFNLLFLFSFHHIFSFEIYMSF